MNLVGESMINKKKRFIYFSGGRVDYHSYLKSWSDLFQWVTVRISFILKKSWSELFQWGYSGVSLIFKKAEPVILND